MPQGIQNEPLYTINGPYNATPIAANTVGPTPVATTAKPGTTRLFSILVTTVGTSPITVYDNPGSGSGTIIGAIPGSAAIGLYPCNAPVSQGITVVGGAAAPAITVMWSP